MPSGHPASKVLLPLASCVRSPFLPLKTFNSISTSGLKPTEQSLLVMPWDHIRLVQIIGVRLLLRIKVMANIRVAALDERTTFASLLQWGQYVSQPQSFPRFQNLSHVLFPAKIDVTCANTCLAVPFSSKFSKGTSTFFCESMPLLLKDNFFLCCQHGLIRCIDLYFWHFGSFLSITVHLRNSGKYLRPLSEFSIPKWPSCIILIIFPCNTFQINIPVPLNKILYSTENFSLILKVTGHLNFWPIASLILQMFIS